MAEKTPEEIREICETFVRAYSVEHSAEFVLTGIPEHEIADFRIGNGKEQIDVQLVLAVGEANHEIVIPNRNSKFVTIVREELEANGLDDLILVLRTRGLPDSEDDQRALAQKLADFVYFRATPACPLVYFSIDERIDVEKMELQAILTHIPFVEFLPNPGGGLRVSAMYDDVPITPKLDNQQVFESTVSKKVKKYAGAQNGVVLLVEAGLYPVPEFYLNKMRRDRGGDASGFKELWIVSTIPNDRWAKRIS